MAATNRTIDKIKPKRTKDEVKHILRGCNAAAASRLSPVPEFSLWYVYANELCGDCCPECTTPAVLKWLWPELEDYDVTMTREEAMADPNVSEIWKSIVRAEE